MIYIFRYTITKMRDLGLSMILPLDHNIYVHKYIGILIFVQAWFHTIMHMINFGVNVQPDPLKFVQINTEFWPKVLSGVDVTLEQRVHHPNWQNLGYNIPEGCEILLDGVGCPEGSTDPDNKITACQVSLSYMYKRTVIGIRSRNLFEKTCVWRKLCGKEPFKFERKCH